MDQVLSVSKLCVISVISCVVQLITSFEPSPCRLLMRYRVDHVNPYITEHHLPLPWTPQRTESSWMAGCLLAALLPSHFDRALLWMMKMSVPGTELERMDFTSIM